MEFKKYSYNTNDEQPFYQIHKKNKTHLYFKSMHDSHLKIAQRHPVVFYTNN